MFTLQRVDANKYVCQNCPEGGPKRLGAAQRRMQMLPVPKESADNSNKVIGLGHHVAVANVCMAARYDGEVLHAVHNPH